MYTAEQYFEKVDLLRKTIPDASIGTDIIVGFPTETEEEFEMTLEAFRKIRYSVAFIYAYSARKGTPAYRWKDDIPEEVKNERLHRLLTLHQEMCSQHYQEMIGQTVEVLVERRNRDELNLKGRTRCWKKVIFPGDDSLIGTLQMVRIRGYNHQTLLGEKAGKRAPALVG